MTTVEIAGHSRSFSPRMRPFVPERTRERFYPSLRAQRSNPLRGIAGSKLDCFAALAMTGVATAGKHTQLSFPDVQLHIVDAPLGAGPESITTDGGYGFRARCCASPRNDGVSWFAFRDYGKDAFASCMRSDASRLPQPHRCRPRGGGPVGRVVRFERRCSMTSSQTTPHGYGSLIALRLCGTTAVELVEAGLRQW